jgi:predicted DNA-binding ribbon-helix-helix protein
MTGKRVQFDDETWQALALLARDRMMDFQELADEAFRDLLHKHGRPTDLKSALRQSVGQDAASQAPKRMPRKRRRSGP